MKYYVNIYRRPNMFYDRGQMGSTIHATKEEADADGVDRTPDNGWLKTVEVEVAPAPPIVYQTYTVRGKQRTVLMIANEPDPGGRFHDYVYYAVANVEGIAVPRHAANRVRLSAWMDASWSEDDG